MLVAKLGAGNLGLLSLRRSGLGRECKVLVCIDCAGTHRSLGAHVSKAVGADRCTREVIDRVRQDPGD